MWCQRCETNKAEMLHWAEECRKRDARIAELESEYRKHLRNIDIMQEKSSKDDIMIRQLEANQVKPGCVNARLDVCEKCAIPGACSCTGTLEEVEP